MIRCGFSVCNDVLLPKLLRSVISECVRFWKDNMLGYEKCTSVPRPTVDLVAGVLSYI